MKKAILISMLLLLMWQISFAQSNIGLGYSIAPAFSIATKTESSSVFTYRDALLLTVFKNKNHFFSAGVGNSWYGYKQNDFSKDTMGTIVVTSKYRYMQIPLWYTYRASPKTFSFSLTTGLLVDLLLKSKVNYHGYFPQESYDKKVLKTNGYRNLFSLYMNPTISINVTDKTFLLTGPDVLYSINSIKNDTNIHFLSFGMQFKLIYTLF